MEQENRKDNLIRYGTYFLLPFLIMLLVFILQRMFPFGNNTPLTYDMNEQYIDFFSFYRSTLLHHPSQLLYSFTNGLGGATIGLWAYYLLSPFNLVLLFTPGKWLPLGIALMTLLKYGTAGFSIGYFLDKTLPSRGRRWILALVVAYPMMGWTLANQFNVMWMDVLVFMPFVLYGIHKIFNQHHFLYFTLFLAITLFTNFYMGYMVCIFACLYFIWLASRQWHGINELWQVAWRFIGGGILGAGSVAFLLCPAYYDIVHSKGQFMLQSIPVKIEYTPWHFLSKFMMGTLNDNQLQNGLPNLFIGSLVIIGFILYFLAEKISWREKIVAGLITLFMGLSLCWSPLDLFWHIFQYPVFYPYRFSFVISTWMVILAARGLTKIGEPNGVQITISLIIPVICWILVAVNIKDFAFLSPFKVLISGIFFAIIYVALMTALLSTHMRINGVPLKLIMIIGVILVSWIEVGVNAQITLSTYQWAHESDFTAFITSLNRNIKWVEQHANKDVFSRIEKTYQRSENDSLQAGYDGISNFSSTQRAAVTSFMDNLGQPTFTGKENYTKGTPLTDALFDVQYFLSPYDQFKNLNGSNITPAASYRPDISYYSIIHHTKNVTVYSNPLALGIGFAAHQSVLHTPSMSQTDTVANQDAIMNAITGGNHQYFQKVGYSINAVNCHLVGGPNGTLVTTDKGQPSSYSIILKNIGAMPYYIQLDSNIFWNASVTINGNPMPVVGNIYQPALVNVAANVPGSTVTLTITPNNGQTLDLSSINVYRFDLQKFTNEDFKIQANSWSLTHNGRIHLAGEVVMPRAHDVLMTTIPYDKGWHVKVDGQRVKARKAFNTFLAVPLTKGKHFVAITYWPPLLNIGILITLIVWGVDYWIWQKERQLN